jgi:sec-independent protein translocase protein TatC
MIAPTPEDEAALNATRAPLMAHLIELRRRLIWAMLSFGICFGVCFYFSTPIMNFLMRPLQVATHHVIYTALTEIFLTQIKIAAFGGLCLAFPFTAMRRAPSCPS